jgi:phosphoribosyl 1,2-cyclic phosphate phosphodiesterase
MNNLIFLGTGTSTGVPQLGCKCEVCTSSDIRDRRLRCSVLITYEGKRFLIDAGPDLRQQFITNKIEALDAILLTHEHYDHVGGLDDLRPLGKTNIYGEKNVLHAIQRNMPYCFGTHRYPGVPDLVLHEINESEFEIDGVKILPIRALHAKLPILGFRIGDLAYLTDVKAIPEDQFQKMKGLKVFVINALRHEEHIAHLSVNEAIDIARRVTAEGTYFTHASHHLGLQRDIEKELPENINFAYDNLSINF